MLMLKNPALMFLGYLDTEGDHYLNLTHVESVRLPKGDSDLKASIRMASGTVIEIHKDTRIDLELLATVIDANCIDYEENDKS